MNDYQAQYFKHLNRKHPDAPTQAFSPSVSQIDAFQSRSSSLGANQVNLKKPIRETRNFYSKETTSFGVDIVAQNPSHFTNNTQHFAERPHFSSAFDERQIVTEDSFTSQQDHQFSNDHSDRQYPMDSYAQKQYFINQRQPYLNQNQTVEESDREHDYTTTYRSKSQTSGYYTGKSAGLRSQINMLNQMEFVAAGRGDNQHNLMNTFPHTTTPDDTEQRRTHTEEDDPQHLDGSHLMSNQFQARHMMNLDITTISHARQSQSRFTTPSTCVIPSITAKPYQSKQSMQRETREYSLPDRRFSANQPSHDQRAQLNQTRKFQDMAKKSPMQIHDEFPDPLQVTTQRRSKSYTQESGSYREMHTTDPPNLSNTGNEKLSQLVNRNLRTQTLDNAGYKYDYGKTQKPSPRQYQHTTTQESNGQYRHSMYTESVNQNGGQSVPEFINTTAFKQDSQMKEKDFQYVDSCVDLINGDDANRQPKNDQDGIDGLQVPYYIQYGRNQHARLNDAYHTAMFAQIQSNVGVKNRSPSRSPIRQTDQNKPKVSKHIHHDSVMSSAFMPLKMTTEKTERDKKETSENQNSIEASKATKHEQRGQNLFGSKEKPENSYFGREYGQKEIVAFGNPQSLLTNQQQMHTLMNSGTSLDRKTFTLGGADYLNNRGTTMSGARQTTMMFTSKTDLMSGQKVMQLYSPTMADQFDQKLAQIKDEINQINESRKDQSSLLISAPKSKAHHHQTLSVGKMNSSEFDQENQINGALYQATSAQVRSTDVMMPTRSYCNMDSIPMVVENDAQQLQKEEQWNNRGSIESRQQKHQAMEERNRANAVQIGKRHHSNPAKTPNINTIHATLSSSIPHYDLKPAHLRKEGEIQNSNLPPQETLSKTPRHNPSHICSQSHQPLISIENQAAISSECQTNNNQDQNQICFYPISDLYQTTEPNFNHPSDSLENHPLAHYQFAHHLPSVRQVQTIPTLNSPTVRNNIRSKTPNNNNNTIPGRHHQQQQLGQAQSQTGTTTDMYQTHCNLTTTPDILYMPTTNSYRQQYTLLNNQFSQPLTSQRIYSPRQERQAQQNQEEEEEETLPIQYTPYHHFLSQQAQYFQHHPPSTTTSNPMLANPPPSTLRQHSINTTNNNMPLNSSHYYHYPPLLYNMQQPNYHLVSHNTNNTNNNNDQLFHFQSLNTSSFQQQQQQQHEDEESGRIQGKGGRQQQHLSLVPNHIGSTHSTLGVSVHSGVGAGAGASSSVMRQEVIMLKKQLNDLKSSLLFQKKQNLQLQHEINLLQIKLKLKQEKLEKTEQTAQDDKAENHTKLKELEKAQQLQEIFGREIKVKWAQTEHLYLEKQRVLEDELKMVREEKLKNHVKIQGNIMQLDCGLQQLNEIMGKESYMKPFLVHIQSICKSLILQIADSNRLVKSALTQNSHQQKGGETSSDLGNKLTKQEIKFIKKVNNFDKLRREVRHLCKSHYRAQQELTTKDLKQAMKHIKQQEKQLLKQNEVCLSLKKSYDHSQEIISQLLADKKRLEKQFDSDRLRFEELAQKEADRLKKAVQHLKKEAIILQKQNQHISIKQASMSTMQISEVTEQEDESQSRSNAAMKHGHDYTTTVVTSSSQGALQDHLTEKQLLLMQNEQYKQTLEGQRILIEELQHALSHNQNSHRLNSEDVTLSDSQPTSTIVDQQAYRHHNNEYAQVTNLKCQDQISRNGQFQDQQEVSVIHQSGNLIQENSNKRNGNKSQIIHSIEKQQNRNVFIMQEEEEVTQDNQDCPTKQNSIYKRNRDGSLSLITKPQESSNQDPIITKQQKKKNSRQPSGQKYRSEQQMSKPKPPLTCQNHHIHHYIYPDTSNADLLHGDENQGSQPVAAAVTTESRDFLLSEPFLPSETNRGGFSSERGDFQNQHHSVATDCASAKTQHPVTIKPRIY